MVACIVCLTKGEHLAYNNIMQVKKFYSSIIIIKLDGVPGTQTSRLLLSNYSNKSHGTVCTTTCKGRIYCIPRNPASWEKMAAIPDDCE